MRSPRLTRVVIGLDFAEASRRATEWVARTFAPNAELVLAHAIVIPTPPAFLGDSRPAREQLVENARRGAEMRMRELSLALRAARVWIEIREEAPAVLMRSLVDEYDADLIVLGGHGEPTGLSVLLGSTARRVIAAAPVPVLLARGMSDGPPRRVLAAISDESDVDALLTWTRFLGQRFDATILLLHVVEQVFASAVAIGASETERTHAVTQMRNSATSWLQREAAARAGVLAAATPIVSFGEPAAEILSTARERGAELLVAGHGGRRGLARALMGSVAERLLRHGDLPVLVVPTAREQAE